MGKSPDAFRTISEVADWLDTQAHVLRFWESKFTQVKPVKRAGGRRYYRPADMMLLGGIKKLLHDDGMTIKGAQKLLREKGTKYVSGLSQPLEGDDDDSIEEIELAEVITPPLEEERGTVLSFERREDPLEEKDEDATVPETPETNADEEGDLFSFTDTRSDEPPALETETAETPEKHEDAEETLSPEDMPSFVQRLSAKPQDQEDAPAPEDKEERNAADITPPEEVPVSHSEKPDETSDDDSPQNGPDTADSTPEPDPSPLSEIATMTEIAPENRTEVAALLDRLAALCERIEASENA